MAARLITKTDFQKLLGHAINLNNIHRRNRLGIAVNHKPESWALMALLRECFPKESLHAISVDLKLNAENSRQTLKAVDHLSAFGVPIKVLECDWQTWPRESAAPLSKKIIKNKLNSILVKECKKNNISILAFGSTFEDYLTDLLREIFSCKAGYVHGLDILSRLGVQGDAVMALRPLLKYNTNQILATCQEYQLLPKDNYIVNQKELDSENPVKKMIIDACESESQRIGDTFLTIPKLLDLGFQMFEHRILVWKKVSTILKRSIRCDESLGLYFIKIDIPKKEQKFHWMNDIEITNTIFKVLLSMTSGLDPLTSKYTPQVLETFRSQLINTSTRRKPVSIAKGLLNPPRASETGKGVWIFGRQPFSKNEIKELTFSITSGETVLWDNRFKVTVFCDNPEKSLLIRPFTIKDFTSLVDDQTSLSIPADAAHSVREKLKLFKNKTPQLLRQTIPCIEMDGKLIGIPSLNINMENQVRIELKYCAYRSAFEKTVGLAPEHFFTETPETQSDSHVHLEE